MTTSKQCFQTKESNCVYKHIEDVIVCKKKTIKDQARWNLNMDEGGTHKVLALDEEISKMIAPGREELVCWTDLATLDPTNPINSLSEYLLQLLSL